MGRNSIRNDAIARRRGDPKKCECGCAKGNGGSESGGSCRSVFAGDTLSAPCSGEVTEIMYNYLLRFAMGAAITPLLLASVAAGQEKTETAAASHKIIHSGDLKWAPIMKGAEMAVVSGDPNAAGAPYVLRLRCTDGSKDRRIGIPKMKT